MEALSQKTYLEKKLLGNSASKDTEYHKFSLLIIGHVCERKGCTEIWILNYPDRNFLSDKTFFLARNFNDFTRSLLKGQGKIYFIVLKY